jgi:hypothetical protein
LFFLIAQVSNTFSLILIKVGFLILSIKALVLQSLGLNTEFILNSFKSSKIDPDNVTKFSKTSHKSYELSLTPNQTYSNDLIDLASSLNKATYALRKLNDSKTVQSLIESLQKSNQIHIDFLLYDLLNLGYSETGS